MANNHIEITISMQYTSKIRKKCIDSAIINVSHGRSTSIKKSYPEYE